MTADARTVDDRIALAQAVAHLTRIGTAPDTTPETADAIDRVLARLNELMAAAFPAVDLAPLKLPHYDEWGWGARNDSSQWWARKHRAIGMLTPDVDGRLVLLSGGVTRDEIPELVAFLTAMHDQSSPAALDERYACDCSGPCPCMDEDCQEEHAAGSHESWCATNDRPVTA